MKYAVIALCFALLGSSYSVPARPARTTALDLLNLLENIVEDEGHSLITKVVHLIHNVEDGVLSIKKLVPKVYEKVHEEADEVLAGLKKVSEEIEELLGKKAGNVLYGFGLLDDLTSLTGGTKLSTVLNVIRLADKAHKVAEDAKGFVPKLENELTKIQGKIEAHIKVLAAHILQELGMQEVLEKSVVKGIEDLLLNVDKEAHKLILILLRNMEEVFDRIKEDLPEAYKKVENQIEDIRHLAREVVTDIGKRVQSVFAYGLLDFAGDLTDGTSLGTAIKVVNLIDKFNTCVKDVKGFEPRAEVFLNRYVKKVALSAQKFLDHASTIISQSP